MRGKTFGTWLLFFSATSCAWAGLYNTCEPDEGKLGNFSLVFRDTLLRLRTISVPQLQIDNPLHKRYAMEAALAAKAIPASLSPEQKLNLAAVLVRTKKPNEAIDILTPLSRQEPKNFLVHSNLATAYQMAGQESRAIYTLEQALAVWPARMEAVEEPLRTFLQALGWHDGAFDFYRKAETYQLKLLRLRSHETLARRGASFETVDALFDDGKKPPSPVRFVGPSGKFEPGQMDPKEKAKLPADAIDIVQQLLVWLPDDVRLYWLLGELYNAQGSAENIQAARMIFDELAGYNRLGVRVPELAEHRMALLNYRDTQQEIPFDFDKRVEGEEKKQQAANPPIDWQNLAIGFGTGLIVAIFGTWQLREIRRRWQNRASR